MDPMQGRLPGLQPVGESGWLWCDEAFAGQMALRDDLVATRRGDVHAAMPGSEAASREVLELVANDVLSRPGYAREGKTILRPDGARVALEGDDPLVVAGRLVQEDLLVLEPGEAGHILVAALTAFPASWTLSEKIGRPLAAIHEPVARYDDALAQRVQRVFDHLRDDAPVWRANVLRYNTPRLFHPRTEDDRRAFDPAAPVWVRVERQTLRRLPATRAIVFTIHTWIVPEDSLSQEERRRLLEHRPKEAP
ncbi:MAG: DUF3445 domain-containing protein [Alphaproteobacteria bacterium]|nr:DUF3445 domain-containing protein [Alphaproteobacteria bacterium]